MSNIFISYAKEDIDFANNVRLALKAEGLSVWWDNNLKSGSPWKKEILEALEKSDVILVLWTNHSKNSDWVKHEASVAIINKKLLQIRVGDIPVIPDIFQTIQASDLSDWNMRDNHQNFQELLLSLKFKIKYSYKRKILKVAKIIIVFISLFIIIIIYTKYIKETEYKNNNNIPTTTKTTSDVDDQLLGTTNKLNYKATFSTEIKKENNYDHKIYLSNIITYSRYDLYLDVSGSMKGFSNNSKVWGEFLASLENNSTRKCLYGDKFRCIKSSLKDIELRDRTEDLKSALDAWRGSSGTSDKLIIVTESIDNVKNSLLVSGGYIYVSAIQIPLPFDGKIYSSGKPRSTQFKGKRNIILVLIEETKESYSSSDIVHTLIREGKTILNTNTKPFSYSLPTK